MTTRRSRGQLVENTLCGLPRAYRCLSPQHSGSGARGAAACTLWRGWVWPGKVRFGKVRRGLARPGWAWLGRAGYGKLGRRKQKWHGRANTKERWA